MNSSELMLGNLVRIKSQDIIAKVTGISQYVVTFEQIDGNLIVDKYVTDEIEPIPLTDEILDKNFENDHGHYKLSPMWNIWMNSNYGYIAATLVVDDFGGGQYEPCVPIRYVHELQNFLKAIKSDIEIQI